MDNAVSGQKVGLLDKGRAIKAGGHFDDPIFEHLGSDHLFTRGLVDIPRNTTRVKSFPDDHVSPQNLAQKSLVL